jgi:uncharacterized membrane protein YedE/YeeE
MSVFTAIVIGLATGIVFGFALEKSRVFEPGVIVGQMQLKNFIMLKIFLTAVITGLVVLAALNGIWGVKLHLKALVLRADLIGGLLLGIGITIAGACPGTSLAQIGAGYRDAWFTLAGGIAGAVTYGYFNTSINAALADTANKVGFDQMIGLPFWVTALAFAAILVVGLVILEKMTNWRDEVGSDYDGLSTPERSTGTAPAKLKPSARGAN